jgi:Integrase core domain/Mu transposase, C-terminal domain
VSEPRATNATVLVEVLFDRILRENGISHRHTGVRSPTTTGKIERFHQSLRREFLDGCTFASAEAAQAELDAWVTEYNTNRPHQALEMATPAERFGLRPIARDGASVPVDPHEDHAGQWVLRRVASNGYVSVDNQAFSVGNAFKAELVDVFVDVTTIQVWSKNHLIKTVARVTRSASWGRRWSVPPTREQEAVRRLDMVLRTREIGPERRRQTTRSSKRSTRAKSIDRTLKRTKAR